MFGRLAPTEGNPEQFATVCQSVAGWRWGVEEKMSRALLCFFPLRMVHVRELTVESLVGGLRKFGSHMSMFDVLGVSASLP